MSRLEPIYLLEFEGRRPGIATAAIHRYATSPGKQLGPGEEPRAAVYEPRIIDPGNVEMHLFTRGLTRGRSVIGKGEITLNNADRALDFLAGEAVDGGALVLRYGADRHAPYPAGFPIVQAGTARRIEFRGREVVLSFADAQAGVMDRPLHGARYGGTNVLPAGVDGTPADLMGKPVPELWGNPGRRITPPCVNSVQYAYQISRLAVASITDIRDKGIVLPIDTVFSSLAALMAASIAPGHSATYLGSATDGAYFRTGSKPVGDPTCDAYEGAAPTDRSFAAVVRRLLTGPGGVADTRIDAAGFALAGAIEPGEVGWWSGLEEGSVGAAIDALCDSAGAWCIPDWAGIFEIGVLRAPMGPPVMVFGRQNILADGLDIVLNGDTDGLPASAVIIRYDRNWSVRATADLAAATPSDDIAYAGQEYRELHVPAQAVAALHPQAKDLILTTVCRTQAAAQRRADRAVAFYCADRQTVTIPVASSVAAGIRRGQIVGLSDRFDWGGTESARPFLVIGEVHERRSGKSFLIVVG